MASDHTGDFGGTLHVLEAIGGARLVITPYGARIVSLHVPDRAGRLRDVVLGFDTLARYRSDTSYLGATIGRYANRIGGARFRLGEREHRLSANEGSNTLHGGADAFDRSHWRVVEAGSTRIVLALHSPDGESGFPGNLDVTVIYELTPPARLEITYSAMSDADTVLNLTNHTYFNLDGGGATTIDEHVLQLRSCAFTEVDRELVPTGRMLPVEGTPFDFRVPRRIAEGFSAEHPQLVLAGGYDHNFVLDGGVSQEPRHVGRLLGPASGIVMEIATTEPGIQLYTGQKLSSTVPGKSGILYGARSGLCLETQHFPDSPNRSEFPSTRLRAGGMFSSRTIWDYHVQL